MRVPSKSYEIISIEFPESAIVRGFLVASKMSKCRVTSEQNKRNYALCDFKNPSNIYVAVGFYIMFRTQNSSTLECTCL